MSRASSLRFGAWLALCSIALQLFLTFGHVHLEDILAERPFDPFAVTQFSAPHSGTGDEDMGLAPDSCTRCASMTSLGSGLLPDIAPALPATMQLAGAVAHAIAHVPTAPRNLRAPPRAPPNV